MAQSQTVEIDSGTVIVRKLPLRDYAAFFNLVGKLSKDIAEVIDRPEADLKDTAKLIEAMVPIFVNAVEPTAQLLALVSDKEQEFYLEAGLDENLTVLAAGLEVNNYEKIVEAVKKVMAQVVKTKPAKESQPAEPAQ